MRVSPQTAEQSLNRNFWQRAKGRLSSSAPLGCAQNDRSMSSQLVAGVSPGPRRVQMNRFRRLILILGIFAPAIISLAVKSPNEEYETVAEEYIRGYLAARPLVGTSL